MATTFAIWKPKNSPVAVSSSTGGSNNATTQLVGRPTCGMNSRSRRNRPSAASFITPATQNNAATMSRPRRQNAVVTRRILSLDDQIVDHHRGAQGVPPERGDALPVLPREDMHARRRNGLDPT